MTRLLLIIAFSVLLTLSTERASAEGRRVALVIGVSAYQSVPSLANAVNDSTAMADLFRKSGFDVVSVRSDVGNLEFKRAIREFEDSVTDADIAVIFYAGHGIEVRETNYLIPADAKLANERDAEDEAISLDRLINALEPAKRLRLIILDACRDNPFASKMKRRVATRAISGGLGRVEPAMSDTLIAYAAKEKNVANDGDGTHSPFTTALLNNIAVPGLDIRLAFGRVRDEVLRATGRKQEPFVYGSLGGGTVALVPSTADAVTPALASARVDPALAKSDYEMVERVGKKEAWEVFLNTHKTGLYADLARVQLAKLSEANALIQNDATAPGRATQVAPKVEVPAVAPVPRPTAEEQKAWDKLKTSTDRTALRKFIERFASSPLVPEAQARLDDLERLARERDEAARLEREAAKQREEEERARKAAEAERKALEREAARQREREERARAAEAERQKAEALAAARQREAEERARVAEELAKKREAEEQAKAAAIAARQREAEERAKAQIAERQKAEQEAAERKRVVEEAAREAARQAAAKAEQERDLEAKAKAIANREREQRELARKQELAREEAARQELARKNAEAEREKAEREAAVKRREAEEMKAAEAERQKAKVAADAERRKAEAAAQAAAERQNERAAAAKLREAAVEAAKRASDEAAVSRKRAAEAARRAAERQAEQAEAAAEQRRRLARQAKEAAKPRAPVQAAPRARVETVVARPAPAPRASGGASSMMGIGF